MRNDAAMNRLLDDIRRAIPQIAAVYVYGSQVRGGQHPGSDLDLALLLPRSVQLSATAIFQLQGDLEAAAAVPVEISILSLDNVVHCKEVLATGQRLFVGDHRTVDEFEMRVLSSYARLCEDRAEVVDAYVRENDNG
jgi:uncharacterized protein